MIKQFNKIITHTSSFNNTYTKSIPKTLYNTPKYSFSNKNTGTSFLKQVRLFWEDQVNNFRPLWYTLMGGSILFFVFFPYKEIDSDYELQVAEQELKPRKPNDDAFSEIIMSTGLREVIEKHGKFSIQVADRLRKEVEVEGLIQPNDHMQRKLKLAESIYAKINGQRCLEVADTLKDLSYYYLTIKNMQFAAISTKKAAEIYNMNRKYEEYFQLSLLHARCHFGDIQFAMNLIDQIINEQKKRFGPANQSLPFSLVEKAHIYAIAGDPGNAQRYIENTLKFTRKTSMEQVVLARLYRKIAEVQIILQSPHQAIKHYNNALNILDPHSEEFLQCQNNVANVFLSLGDLSQAARRYDDYALKIKDKAGRRYDHARVLGLLGEIYAQQKAFERSFERFNAQRVVYEEIGQSEASIYSQMKQCLVQAYNGYFYESTKCLDMTYERSIRTLGEKNSLSKQIVNNIHTIREQGGQVLQQQETKAKYNEEIHRRKREKGE